MFLRRSAAAVTAVLAAATLLCAAPAPAASAAGRDSNSALAGGPRAAAGYRYWSFWRQQKNGRDWSYATKGPSGMRPSDGAVLGFRFALSTDSADAAKPRTDIRFDAVCGRTKAKPDRKRVAIGIDFGTAAHAPRGESPPKARTACARVADDARAADALAAVSRPLRYNSDALLCAIDGYPRHGCGEQDSGAGKQSDGKHGAGKSSTDKNGATESDGSDQGDGILSPAVGIGAGVLAAAVLAAGAVRQTRRRRHQP